MALFGLTGFCRAAGRGKVVKSNAGSEWKLPLELVGGIPVIEISTSQGAMRMVVDTGSNGTSVDDLRSENLIIHLKGLDVPVKIYRTVTPILAHFNSFAGTRKRVHGIVGNDFFSRFDFFTFDYRHHELRLSRTLPAAGDQVTFLSDEHSVGQSRDSSESPAK